MPPIRTTSTSTIAPSTATSSASAASSAKSMATSTQSKHCMALATVFRRNRAEPDAGDLSLRWSGNISLTTRILALNIFALALLAGGFFYLDSYRSRILDSRSAQASREARLIAAAINASAPDHRAALALQLARDTGTRIRLF